MIEDLEARLKTWQETAVRRATKNDGKIAAFMRLLDARLQVVERNLAELRVPDRTHGKEREMFTMEHLCEFWEDVARELDK